jgi:hypothetical protein
LLLPFLLLSCVRPSVTNSPVVDEPDASSIAAPFEVTPPMSTPAALPPLAVLRSGEYPLWFQLSDAGPLLLDSIDDACFSAALVPWPLAPHVRFVLARGNELLMAVNRDGFVRFAPWDAGNGAADTGLFYFSGGEFWRQYTVGAFVFVDEQPAALLYRDDRFLDSGAALPSPRLWTFDVFSAGLEALDIPALAPFPPDEGWDADTLRPGGDGFWYYRVVKKTGPQPEMRLFRAASLGESGQAASLGAFQNSALSEPLAAAPDPLREPLAAAFKLAGGGTAMVLSPEFPQPRHFAANSGSSPLIPAYYRGGANALVVAILPDGRGFYSIPPAGGETAAEDAGPQPCSLPPLPEGFIYTAIGLCGDTLLAAWEEQDAYNTGAAGFMALRFR